MWLVCLTLWEYKTYKTHIFLNECFLDSQETNRQMAIPYKLTHLYPKKKIKNSTSNNSMSNYKTKNQKIKKTKKL